MARKRKRIRLKFSKLVCLLLILWLGYVFGKGFAEHQRLRKQIDKLTYEIKAYELRNDKIRQEIERQKSPEYIERVAREELGLVMPGETRYIISEPKEE